MLKSIPYHTLVTDNTDAPIGCLYCVPHKKEKHNTKFQWHKDVLIMTHLSLLGELSLQNARCFMAMQERNIEREEKRDELLVSHLRLFTA